MHFERAPGIDLDVINFTAAVHESPVPGVGGAPQLVLRTDQAWQLVVHWEVIGVASSTIHGTWQVECYLESIGAGGEFEIPQATAPMGAPTYDLVLSVAPAFVAPHMAPGEPSTPFKLTTTLTAVDHAGHVWPMAGYEDGPIVQFFVP